MKATFNGIKADLDIICAYFYPYTKGNDISHQQMLDYRNNILRKLPKKFILEREQRRDLSNIAESNTGERISITTLNNKLTRIGGFFTWCCKHGYINENPALDLKIKEGDNSNEKRNVYSFEDLKLIFSNLRQDQLNAWRPHKLLIPMIALYTGARINEICQLYVDDIQLIDETPCFHIRENTERNTHLKNSASTRIIPFHPDLLKAGLLTYLHERIKSKDLQLRPLLNYSEKHGYSNAFGKFYGKFQRKHIADKKKVFHSFRHGFINNLKQQGQNENIIMELSGRAQKTITFGRYGKNYEVKPLYETICKLDYGINIIALTGIKPLSDDVIAKQIEKLSKKQLLTFFYNSSQLYSASFIEFIMRAV